MNRFNIVLGQGIPRPAAPKVSGLLEVIAPEDGFSLEKCLPLSRHTGIGMTDAMKEQKNWQNGRLHVFGPKQEVVIEPVQTVPRIGCGKESTSRPYTPSKQILLCTAKSLEKKTNEIIRQSTLTRSSKNQNPKTTPRLHESIQNKAEICNDPQLKPDLPKLNHETQRTGANVESEDENEQTSRNDGGNLNGEVSTDTKESSGDKQRASKEPPGSSDDDECNGEQSNAEAEKRTAPLQLMGEFLKAIMERDYSLAKKLCQMILIYEPQNPEAKQFLPLIELKLQLESVQEADSEGPNEESTDGSEEDTTSNTEDSETETDTSSEDSDN